MITTAFDKAFGTTELCLSEMILKVHDAVPNRDKPIGNCFPKRPKQCLANARLIWRCWAAHLKMRHANDLTR